MAPLPPPPPCRRARLLLALLVGAPVPVPAAQGSSVTREARTRAGGGLLGGGTAALGALFPHGWGQRLRLAPGAAQALAMAATAAP